MSDNFKIRIFQPIVPEYRKAFFDGIANHYGNRIEVWASNSLGGNSSVALDAMRHDYSHSFRKLPMFLWQNGLSLKGLSRGDVIVVCGDVHQLSSLWAALKARCLGLKVVWWGHHRTASSRALGVKIRLMVARLLANVMLTYTKSGVAYLESLGFEHGRVFATGNTIDQSLIKKAAAEFDGVDRFAGRKGLLCCSVLREKVKLDQVIRVLADPRLADAVLAVIGDGVMRKEYERVAEECGVAERVLWVGATRDQGVMAPWFLSAKAFVYPGPIGLSILHSMSYGLPVVVHDNAAHQMPEYEVMEDGRTGVCFKENDLKDLLGKLVGLLEDEPRRLEMARYCQKLAFEKYSMDNMISNFIEAIEACHRAGS